MSGFIYSNLGAAAALTLIFILRKLFKYKLSAKCFVLLWMIVVFRLLLPFEISSAFSVYPTAAQPRFSEVNTEDSFAGESFESAGESADYPLKGPMTEGAETVGSLLSSKNVFMYVWAAGALLTGGYFAVTHFWVAKKIRSACLPFGSLPKEFTEICGQIKSIAFFKSKRIVSPISFGVIRPTIVIPETVSEKQLTFVLLHEYVHTRDRDAALKAAAAAALALNWFNPMVWAMIFFFERDMEVYCDERVLSFIGDEKAPRYAGVILDFAERQSFSWGFSYFSAASLKERVISIMKIKERRFHRKAAVALFAAVVIALAAFGTAPISAAAVPAGDHMGFMGENAENSYVTGSFFPTEGSAVTKVTVKGFSFAEEVETVIECIPAKKFFVDFTYGEVLGAHGFGVEQRGEEVIISTSESCKDTDEYFFLRIYADFEKVKVVSESVELSFMEETKAPPIAAGSAHPDYDLTWNFYSVFGSNWGEPLKDCDGVLWMPLSAMEISATMGESIYAMEAGTVLDCGFATGYGNIVIVDHGGGYSSVYGHCDEILVRPGDAVAKGGAIATVGNTGNPVFPSALYVDVLYNGETVFYLGGDFKTSLEHYEKKLKN